MSDSFLPVDPDSTLTGDIHKVVTRFRNRVDAEEQMALVSMTNTYRGVIDNLSTNLSEVTGLIGDRLDRGETVSVSWLHKQQRYQTLLREAGDEFRRYGRVVGEDLDFYQQRAVDLGRQSGAALIKTRLPLAGIEYRFDRLATGPLKQLTGMTSQRGPLQDILRGFGYFGQVEIQDAIASGLAQGLSPNEVDRLIRDRLKTGVYRKTATIARTTMYQSFREANREVFLDNDDIVDGWTWNAYLGPFTCAACWAMHGEEFKTTEPMGSHPNCRCTMIPKTKSWEDLGFPEIPDKRVKLPRGQDVFDQLSDADQRRILGPKKYDLYRRDEIKLPDVVRRTESYDWGTNRTIASAQRALAKASRRIGREFDEADRLIREREQAAKVVKAQVEKGPAWLKEARAKIAAIDPRTVTEAQIRDLGATIREGLKDVLPADYEKNAKALLKARGRLYEATQEVKQPPANSRAYYDAYDEYKKAKLAVDDLVEKLTPKADAATAKRVATITKAKAKIDKDMDALIAKYDSGGLSYDDYLNQIEELGRKRGKLAVELSQLRTRSTAVEFDLSESALKALRQVRSFGSTQEHRLAKAFEPIDWHRNGRSKRLKAAPDMDVARTIQTEGQRYPSDWWEKSIARGDIMPGKAERGYAIDQIEHNLSTPSEIVTSGTDPTAIAQTVVHEIGHRMERSVDGITRLESQFYDRRTRGDPLVNMSWSPDGREQTRPDSFFNEYIGKDYGRNSFEIFAMGVEGVLSPKGASKGGRPVHTDIEHFDFILGVLAGL